MYCPWPGTFWTPPNFKPTLASGNTPQIAGIPKDPMRFNRECSADLPICTTCNNPMKEGGLPAPNYAFSEHQMAIAIIIHPKHYVHGDKKHGAVFLWAWSALDLACFPDIEFGRLLP